MKIINKSSFDLKNKHCNYIFIIFLISFSSVFFCSCNSASPILEAKNESPTNINAKQFDLQNFNQTQSVDFKGVSFQNKISFAFDVKASEEPAVPLEDENDKADYVQSRRILFKFNGEYAEKHKESSSRPEITVYPIAEYRQACAKSKSLVEAVDKSNEKLQKIIDAKTVKRRDIYRMNSIVGSTEILAQIKLVSFNNGKGVSYITQYSPDWANIINNQQLEYIFRGITTDKKYYVHATFPIALEGLPDSHYDTKFRDYEIPDTYFDKERKPELFAAYKKYLSSMENLLNNSKTNKFSPDLAEIEETLSSLEVNWKD